MIQAHSAHSWRHGFKWMYQQRPQDHHNAARSERRHLVWLGAAAGPKPQPGPHGGSSIPNPTPDTPWKPGEYM